MHNRKENSHASTRKQPMHTQAMNSTWLECSLWESGKYRWYLCTVSKQQHHLPQLQDEKTCDKNNVDRSIVARHIQQHTDVTKIKQVPHNQTRSHNFILRTILDERICHRQTSLGMQSGDQGQRAIALDTCHIGIDRAAGHHCGCILQDDVMHQLVAFQQPRTSRWHLDEESVARNICKVWKREHEEMYGE